MKQPSLIGSVVYLRRHYGIPARDLLAAWKEARSLPVTKDFMGHDRTPVAAMFQYAAHRGYEECVRYRCVNGCCVVLWHPKRGNQGGGGPAGCSCDDLADPRDIAFGPLPIPVYRKD